MGKDSTFFHRTPRPDPLCLGTRTFIVDDFQQVCLRVGTMTDQRSTTPRRARLSLIAHKTLPKTERTQGLGAFDICEQISNENKLQRNIPKKLSQAVKLFITYFLLDAKLLKRDIELLSARVTSIKSSKHE